MKTTILKQLGVWLLPFLLPVTATAAHNYVDLGLPSGTLWADCNVGASSPEGYGNFYAWGETSTKSSYSWSNYQYANGSSSTAQNLGTHIAGTSYDAATKNWGSDWVMPTIDQANELLKKCTVSLATVNSVKGLNFKGPNGKSIFIPMTGYKYDSKYSAEGTQCYIWTDTKDNVTNVAYKALALYFERSSTSAKANTTPAPRRSGVIVRAVRAAGGSTPDDPDDPGQRPYTPYLVDIGLSVKWCDVNLDADSYNGYGNYYAWGETSKKSTYTWANYKYASGSASTAQDIGVDIRATQYDAAFKGSYAEDEDGRAVDVCMPTKEQFQELIDNCTWKEQTFEGVKGYMVIGPNGSGIFLPLSGYSYDGSTSGKGSSCYYWTADMDDNIQKANALYIKSGTAPTITAAQRRSGFVIRPVACEGGEALPLNRNTSLVDLGLSVRWCDENLSTNYEGEYGFFYAWGETDRKATYTWANYQHASGSATTVNNIGSNIQGTSYDAAYQNCTIWDYDTNNGKKVCIPTKAQWEELRTKCTWTETTANGHKGYKVKGPSGKSIFLPFSGCSYDGNSYNKESASYYWTSEVDASNEQKANSFYIKTGTASKLATIQRRTGAVIRAVEYKAAAQGVPYAVLSTDEKTLTFYCDNLKSTRTGKKLNLNTGENTPDWFTQASSWFSTQTTVTKVVFDSSFANARPTSTYYWFRGMKNLATITGINYLNTSEVTNMSFMFTNCTSLASINVSNFNTAKVTNFESMFEGCSKISSIDVSKFNTANAVNLYCMFNGCSGLKSLNVSNFNTAKAEEMGCLFASCSGLTSIDVSKFNTAKADISSMFYQCTGLTSIDISNFVIKSSVPQYSVVNGCTGLTSLTIPATATNFYSNACLGVGSTSKPCVVNAPSGFNFGVSTSGNYFQWKGGYFKLASTPPPSGSHNYVDLGLPSGTLWADCNVGASKPEAYGNFYAWGETSTKSSYSWSNYQYASGSSSTAQNLGTHIAGTNYDAAKKNWGGDWVMPTIDQANELLKKCTVSLATVNNVKGLKFKGPNGNTIFFPMTGYKYDSKYSAEGTQCYIWTDTKDNVTNVAYKSLAIYMERSSSSAKANTTPAPRRSGVIVRAVKNGGGSVDPVIPPAKEPELVDLGLSVKWCDQNLGADNMSQNGSYYSWGEIYSKDTYTWANYEHANGSSSTVMNIGSDIQCTDYDAAAMSGEVYDPYAKEMVSVCIPNKEQWEELRTKCTWKEATEYDHKGYKVTGPNGNSIFLPFSGSNYDGSQHDVGTNAYYWTSEIYSSNTGAKASAFYIKTATAPKMYYAQKRTGLNIRAVEIYYEGGTEESTIGYANPELVDLGLSVRWCDVNLGYTYVDHTVNGVSTVTEDWYYYAWGETWPKSDYTWANYKHANGTASSVKNIGSNIQATDYDAAYSIDDYFGNNNSAESPRRPAKNGMSKTARDPKTDQQVDICIPTKEQYQELLTKCTWTVVNSGDNKYYKVTGPNGNHIYFELTGAYYDGSCHNKGVSAYYWTSEVYASDASKASALYLKPGTTPKLSTAQRRTGITVRAVEYKGSTPTPPPSSDHQYVNLGLPSGTLWADCNVGASSPEEYGNYYAWGETSTKSTYSWSNYLYASGSSSTCQNLGTHIAGTSYDAATKNWGSNWVMPTIDQANELLKKCTISLATVNGVAGLRFKGPNGNSIFIPMSGYKYDSKYSAEGTQCYIWTDTKDNVTNVAYKALALYFERSSSSAKANTTPAPRRSGVNVRAVRAGSGSANSYDFETDGVSGVNIAPPSDGSTYTIQGVKVEGELKPGIYIRNGKKFVVK